MSRWIPVVLAAILSMAGAVAQEGGSAQAVTGTERPGLPPTPLRGVWKVTEQSYRVPGGSWTERTPDLSQYIFTEEHYSYMFTLGAGPRGLFAGDPNHPTDAEKAGAYDSFVAASGTYVLSGTTLTLRALLHKNPNEMTGEPLTFTIEIEGDTLRMTTVNPVFAPGQERRTVLTRTR